MTYVVGQRANLRTTITDATSALTDATVVLTVTAPDGTVSTPAVNHPSTGTYNADVTFDQPGDWLRVWSTTGAVVSSNVDQVHVIAPTLRIVGLAEVKEHGNITSTNSDSELLDFIGTAQQMIEDLVGPTVPRPSPRPPAAAERSGWTGRRSCRSPRSPNTGRPSAPGCTPST
jgi:hypothetical protein